MKPAEHDAERLHAAIEALRGGASADAACAGLPAELSRMARVAAGLERAARSDGTGPRPSFVLGLEEQLRTDLRLAAPLVRPAARLRRVTGAVLVALAAGLVLGIVADRAAPATALYPFKRAVEEVRVRASWTAVAKSRTCLDLGWRRLDEVRWLVAAGGPRAAALEAVLRDLEQAYASAVLHATESGDGRAIRHAAAETELAAGRLAEIERIAPAEAAALVGETRRALVRLVVRGGGAGEGAGAAAPPSVPPPTAAAPSPTATVPAAAATDVPPTDPPPPTRAPPTASPRAPASATPPPPSATPTEQVARPPKPDPDPTDTPRPPSSTPPAAPVDPTPTPDVWTPRPGTPVPSTVHPPTPEGEPSPEPTAGDPAGTREPTAPPSSDPGTGGPPAAGGR